MTFWIDGEYRTDGASINIADRGFLLGDGLFETILLKDGVPAFLGEHVARLKASAAQLFIPEAIDESEIATILATLADRNGAAKGFASARLTLTRGAGVRGLAFEPSQTTPTMLATLAPYTPPDEGAALALIVAKTRRSEMSIAANHKTLGYLDNVLARQEAKDAGADDAAMLNHQGRAACASAANLFVIAADGRVKTPPLSEGALPGIVRAVLIALAGKAGVTIEEAPVTADELASAQLFLTNSLMGLRPARHKSAAQTGGDHRILQSLQSCYAERVAEDLKRRASR